jgi:hypothetical protein
MKIGHARITREHIIDAAELAHRHLRSLPSPSRSVGELLAELDWVDLCAALERAARRVNDRAAGGTR